MLAFYLLAIASGALAAVAVALWMRVRRLDKQNDAFLEVWREGKGEGERRVLLFFFFFFFFFFFV